MLENRSGGRLVSMPRIPTDECCSCEADCEAVYRTSPMYVRMYKPKRIYVQNMQDPRCAIPARLGITLCVLLEEWCWYNLPSFGVVFA